MLKTKMYVIKYTVVCKKKIYITEFKFKFYQSRFLECLGIDVFSKEPQIAC